MARTPTDHEQRHVGCSQLLALFGRGAAVFPCPPLGIEQTQIAAREARETLTCFRLYRHVYHVLTTSLTLKKLLTNYEDNRGKCER